MKTIIEAIKLYFEPVIWAYKNISFWWLAGGFVIGWIIGTCLIKVFK